MSEVKTTSQAAFARQLKAWREIRGWTQVEAGARLGYSASLISGVETLDKNATAEFAHACDKGFGTPGFAEDEHGNVVSPGTFLELRRLVEQDAWPSYFAPIVPYERDAVQVHQWDMRVIPGLLQTEEYARSVISAGKPRDSVTAIERLVTARMERQAILAKDNPPMLWHVLHEGVLRHVVGSRAVMSAQLGKLTELSGTPGIVIQVLPFSAHDHPGIDGPILIYDFDQKPSVAYTECNGGGRVIESPGEVADLLTALNLIRAVALSPRASRELISQVRSEIDG